MTSDLTHLGDENLSILRQLGDAIAVAIIIYKPVSNNSVGFTNKRSSKYLRKLKNIRIHLC